jgi:hypothetical protein
MSTNNAVPLRDYRSVVADNIQAVFGATRDAAAKVAASAGDGIQKVYDNPFFNYGGAKESIKNLQGDGGIS